MRNTPSNSTTPFGPLTWNTPSDKTIPFGLPKAEHPKWQHLTLWAAIYTLKAEHPNELTTKEFGFYRDKALPMRFSWWHDTKWSIESCTPTLHYDSSCKTTMHQGEIKHTPQTNLDTQSIKASLINNANTFRNQSWMDLRHWTKRQPACKPRHSELNLYHPNRQWNTPK